VFASIVEGLNRAYNREQEQSAVVNTVANGTTTPDIVSESSNTKEHEQC